MKAFRRRDPALDRVAFVGWLRGKATEAAIEEGITGVAQEGAVPSVSPKPPECVTVAICCHNLLGVGPPYLFSTHDYALAVVAPNS